MKGVVMIESSGIVGKWPGGDSVTFAVADVVALGKQRCHGDFVTRYVVRLEDGREAMVESDGRTEAEQRWLRRTSKRIPFGVLTSRDCPEVTDWVPVR